jgi:TATA-box binding protein (TBP) (component of TFIID and TFIIIB)
MEAEGPAIREDEQEEMIRLLNKCKIKISNYVYTIKIVIDRQASVNDPRICKGERSFYVPEPFATYLASLEHVRKPESINTIRDAFDVVETDHEGKPYPEYDPYVFAMLSGLRSMSEETEEYVNTVVSSVDTGAARAKKRRVGGYSQDSHGNSIHVWNENPMVDRASKEAITKGRQIHGPQSYSVSPFDRFDLVDLVRKFAPYSAKCNLPRFAAVILRTYKPSASCSIFAPKKAVNTGARTDGVGQYVVMKTLLYLREKGYKRACPLGDTFTAENVVATFILPFRIDLDKLCECYPDIVSYNPETFPGVRVRAPQIAPAAQLVFATGRVVTMGGRSPPDHVRALSSTFPMYFSVREQ